MFPKYDAVNGQFLSSPYNAFQRQERYDSFGKPCASVSWYKPAEFTTTLGTTIGRVDRWDRVEAPGGFSTGLRFSNDGLYNVFGTRVGQVDRFGVVRDSLGCDTGVRLNNRNW